MVCASETLSFKDYLETGVASVTGLPRVENDMVSLNEDAVVRVS